MFSKILVKAPVSTANLGSNFDHLGLALNLFNFIEIEKNPKSEQFIYNYNDEN